MIKGIVILLALIAPIVLYGVIQLPSNKEVVEKFERQYGCGSDLCTNLLCEYGRIHIYEQLVIACANTLPPDLSVEFRIKYAQELIRFQAQNGGRLRPNTNGLEFQPGSPAIDAGADLGSDVPWQYDICGVRRPQGKGWDIGAYEFVPPKDTVPPLPPTDLKFVEGE